MKVNTFITNLCLTALTKCSVNSGKLKNNSRPYSKEGEPMPWSRKQRKLKTNRIKTDEIDTERIFELVKHDVSKL